MNKLKTITSPQDLKKLPQLELNDLASEIRELLLETVAANGGHLAPNLGVVELTLALHYVFNAPDDKLVWDVGHQAYVHKILTGRQELFKTLRQFAGCSGFLSREESEFDTFGAGHAGTALSAAAGMATARDQRQSSEHVVAIVGDGSIGCGISLEALNNIKTSCKRLIIILNDNKMSISENVGAISRNLNHLIAGKRYNRFKKVTKKLVGKLPYSKNLLAFIRRLEEATKGIFVPGMLFEEFGIRYIGPIDGHDLDELISTMQGVKEFNTPVIIHAITEKGRGYSPAESAPEKFHGLGSFDPLTGEKTGNNPPTTFSQAFGNSMLELAATHPELKVISAGMTAGTGLTEFAEKYPKQFHDVGIAEEHAVVFAAGLAAAGSRPVVAIYATFIQRALDSIYHDVCLQNLPVIFCLDRAGIVEDGPTHHGLYDLPFMLTIPNLAILAPKNEVELTEMIKAAYDYNGPVVIRYPRGWSGDSSPDAEKSRLEWGKSELVKAGNDVAIWSTGREINSALAVADILLRDFKIKAKVINTRFLAPFDQNLLFECAEKMPIATIEDGIIQGGLGTIVDQLLINVKHHGTAHFGWEKQFISHGVTDKLREQHNFTVEKIAKAIAKL
jgi:1-deoxy-D-xylulose-5-phosphate synthase